METIDLDIDNYNLNDLLNLFKLDADFDEKDLKRAKQIVLKTHPDKSGLDSKYFLFFSKAYKTLFSIYNFKNNSEKSKPTTIKKAYDSNIDNNDNSSSNINKELAHFFKTNEELKKAKNFNKWFNEQFNKYKIQSEEDSVGYGEWLKSNEDCDEEQYISQNELGNAIERKKKQVRDLTVYKDYDELYFTGPQASNLTGEAPQDFSSDIFSNLHYQDLRQAHRESVIPVTKEDYDNKRKFKNVDEYALYRDTQRGTPLSEQQAKEYLKNKDKIRNTESTQRAFLLAKQMEEAQKRNNEFMGSIKYLKDK